MFFSFFGLRYHSSMNPPKDAEFQKFTSAMRDILKVSKTDLQRRMRDEKAEKRKPSKTSASRASGASPKRAT